MPPKQPKATKPKAEKKICANREMPAASLANLKLFEPGVSGNPSGRPKGQAEVKKLAREFSKDAIATLAEIMKDKEATPSARVTAAEALLDRGYGKAVQQVEHGGAGAFENMEDSELDQFILEKASNFVSGYSLN